MCSREMGHTATCADAWLRCVGQCKLTPMLAVGADTHATQPLQVPSNPVIVITRPIRERFYWTGARNAPPNKISLQELPRKHPFGHVAESNQGTSRDYYRSGREHTAVVWGRHASTRHPFHGRAGSPASLR